METAVSFKIADVIEIITALTPIVLAVIAFMQYRQGNVLKEQTEAVKALEVNTNSNFDLLLKKSEVLAKATGVAEGMADQKAVSDAAAVDLARAHEVKPILLAEKTK